MEFSSEGTLQSCYLPNLVASTATQTSPSHLHTVPSNSLLAGRPILLHIDLSQWFYGTTVQDSMTQFSIDYMYNPIYAVVLK